ncbi:hypothetical protein [Zhouia amylolytica]|uniref:hypothetical protein n=1 Tax=Zhouia amylolytica TaxID=376730 RepID=UPI0020CD1781|nr:hypothetical protein [Zhouia amylolytica]MCQ0113032.1 hypothetical protein [Zhouia amylolytica]
MLVKQFGAETAGVFEVKKPVQALRIKNILKTAKIKITEFKNGTQTVRFPEMTVQELLTINKGLEKRSVIVQENSTTGEYDEILILLSANGVLLFDDDYYYSVEIKDKDTLTTSVYGWDAKDSIYTPVKERKQGLPLGKPITVSKAKIDATESDKIFSVYDTDMLFFNGVMPTKISYLVPDGKDLQGRDKNRTVSITADDIKYHNKGGRIQFKNVSGTLSEGSLKPVYPLRGITQITVHHDTSLDQDLNFYQVDAI